jgi:phage terminase large subunit
MNYKYTTALKKIRSLKKRIRAVIGGSSAGKSISIIIILIDKCIKNPGLEVSVVSQSIPHLKKGVNRDFIKLMKDTGRYIDTNYNKTTLKYTFSNGSFIEFFSVEDESRVRGARRDVLWVNEATDINWETYLQLSIRTNKAIYMDWNPSHKFWYYTELQDRDDVDEITLTYKDNEALNQNIIDQLESFREKALTSKFYQRWCDTYLDGKLGGVLEGVVYEEYEIIDTIPEESRSLCFGLDWGFSQDPTALVHILKYNDYLIIDEVIYQKGLLNSDIANLMKSLGVGQTEIYCDSSEPKSIAELKKYGYNVKGVVKGKDSVNYGIQLVQQQKLMITKSSKNLLEELNNYTYKRDKDGFTSIPIDAYNHALDATRYAIVSKFGSNKYSGNAPSIMIGNFGK